MVAVPDLYPQVELAVELLGSSQRVVCVFDPALGEKDTSNVDVHVRKSLRVVGLGG
jgi:hypothetical protein